MTENANAKEGVDVYKDQLDHMSSFVSAFASSIASDIATVGPEASRKPIADLTQLGWTGNFNEDVTPA